AEPTLIQTLTSAVANSTGRGNNRRPSDFLVDARRFAGQITQVVQLGAPNRAAALHADFADRGAESLEHAFHSLAVRNFAHRERRIEAAILLRGDHAFEGRTRPPSPLH